MQEQEDGVRDYAVRWHFLISSDVAFFSPKCIEQVQLYLENFSQSYVYHLSL